MNDKKTVNEDNSGKRYTNDSLFEGISRYYRYKKNNIETFTTEGSTSDIDYSEVVALFRQNNGNYSENDAARWITAHSYPRYIKGVCGYCARAVRLAIEAGGISTSGRPNWAWKYVNWLPTIGFELIETLTAQTAKSYQEKTGDIAVYQKNNNPNVPGHICMFNGNQWVSDFKQNSVNVYSTFPAYIWIFRYKHSYNSIT